MRYMPWKYPAKPLLTVIILASLALLLPQVFAAEKMGRVIAKGTVIHTPVWCGNEMVLVYRADPQKDMEHNGLGTEAIDLGSGKRFFVSRDPYEGAISCNGANGQILLARTSQAKATYGQTDIRIFDLATRQATLLATARDFAAATPDGRKVLVLGPVHRYQLPNKAKKAGIEIYASKQPYTNEDKWEAALLPDRNQRVIFHANTHSTHLTTFLLESERGVYPLTFKEPNFAQVEGYFSLKTNSGGRIFFMASVNRGGVNLRRVAGCAIDGRKLDCHWYADFASSYAVHAHHVMFLNEENGCLAIEQVDEVGKDEVGKTTECAFHVKGLELSISPNGKLVAIVRAKEILDVAVYPLP